MIIICLFFYCKTKGQDTINQKRFTTTIAATTGLYIGTMTGLYQTWYKEIPSSNFHFFNDFNQWNYMDKIGHSMTSYYIGLAGYSTLKWCGVSEKKSVWYGGMFGTFFLTTVEIFDGFSSNWGFSGSDMASNVIGSGIFVSQQLAWKEQRILLKYSFYQSEYAQLRPNILGRNLREQLLKDYNGQTYWLSFNISSLVKIENSFPKWLNLAVGYGAEGLIGGTTNTYWSGNQLYDYSTISRRKQLFLSLDADLTKIKTKNRVLKTLFTTFGFIKVPFPSLVWEESKGIKLLPIQ